MRVFDSADRPDVAPGRGSSQWSLHVKGSLDWSASGMCRRSHVKEQQRLSVRHSVLAVKMVVLSRHKHKVEPREKKSRVRKCRMCASVA